MSDSEARLHVRTPDVPAGIELQDAMRRTVAEGFGEIDEMVAEGLYRLRVDAGTHSYERLIAVEGSGYEDLELPTRVLSAAPVAGSVATHEFHEAAAWQLANQPTHGFGAGARLVVLVRNLATSEQDDYEPRLSAELPYHELSLLSLGHDELNVQRLIDRGAGARGVGPEGWAGWSVDLEPGAYALRWEQARGERRGIWRNPMRVIDQPLYVAPDWITFVFIGHRPETGMMRANASMHMSPLHEPEWAWSAPGRNRPVDPSRDLAGEVVLGGLRRGQALVGRRTLNVLLGSKFENAMLGLLGGHALLARPKPKPELVDVVLRNLRRLVSEQHPDWQALCVMARRRGLSAPDVRGVTAPPMLRASYQALIEQDPEQPGLLVPGSPAERLASRLRPEAPWTTFVPIDERQTSGREDEYRAQAVRASGAPWLAGFAKSVAAPSAAPLAPPVDGEASSPEVRRVSRWVEAARDQTIEDLRVEEIAAQCGLPVASTARALAYLEGLGGPLKRPRPMRPTKKKRGKRKRRKKKP